MNVDNSEDHKKIIHVPRRFTRDAWGGTESVIASLTAQQQQEGWSPQIHTSLALSDQRREEYNQVPVYRYPYTYPFFGLGAQQREAMDQKGGNLISFALFSALLRMKGVRLFHAHALKRLGAEVLAVARLKCKPLVLTLHGGVFDVPEAELEQMAVQRKKGWEWGKIVGWCLGSRKLLERAHAVICVGLREYEEAKKLLHHPRIYHLGNGVNVERFAQGDRTGFRHKLGIPQDALLLACYSRFDPQKNQELLIEVFDQLAHQFPNLYLVLAGPTTDALYLQQLDERIKLSPWASRIRRLGALRPDHHELADAYHACDLFVLGSRHEPFGIVVLEAWSARRPVVASRVGGLQHLVEHGKDGFLFDPQDQAACAGYIGQLLKDQELRKTMGEHGYQKVCASYTWAHIAAQTETIYQIALTTSYSSQIHH